MDTEELKTIFVSESIANKLKSIGFDSKCLLRQDTYHHDKFTCITFKEDQEISYDIENEVLIEDLKLVKNSKLPKDNISLYKDYKSFVTIPTYEQAFKWFRNKGFCITLENHKENTRFMFYNMEVNKGKHFKGNFPSYEKARKELINKLIEIYKNKLK